METRVAELARRTLTMYKSDRPQWWNAGTKVEVIPPGDEWLPEGQVRARFPDGGTYVLFLSDLVQTAD